MTALKCVLWRRPRKHSTRRRHQSGMMSLVHSTHNERKSKLKSKHWLKQLCGPRRYSAGKPEREMPYLEPTSGSDVTPRSPEMPTLLPFTTEHEDPTSGIYQITYSTSSEKDGHRFVRVLRGGSKVTYQPVVVLKRLPPLEGSPPQQEGIVPDTCMPFEPEELRREGLPSPLGGYSSAREEEDWLQWPEEYEGCSCEDVVDVSPVNSFPEIDIVDGLEFFSFLQEEDMNNYSRLHSRPLFFGESFTPPRSDESVTPTSEDFGEDKSGGLIVPTKTKDITQIKGWKRKLFAEDCEDFESGSWIQKKEEGDVTPVEEKPPPIPACSAFMSSSLEDFLKTSSKLSISYLASYIPNVTPIPSDSPILSVGTLSKDGGRTREPSSRKDFIVQKTLLSSCVVPESKDLVLPEEQKNSSVLESRETRVSSSVPSLSAKKEEETVPPVANDPVEIEVAEPQSEQDSPTIELPFEQILFTEGKCHRSLIREPVLDGEEDRQRLSDFLSELRQPDAYDVSRCKYEGPKADMPFPTITENVALAATSAFGRLADAHEKKCSLQRKRKNNTTTSIQAVDAPEKRNKRKIRLPARFMDSALMIPGSEAWVTTELHNSSSRKRRRKSEVSERAGEQLRSRSNKIKCGNAVDSKTESAPDFTVPLLENQNVVSVDFSKGGSDCPEDMLKLKHLKGHDIVGTSVVRSLLIVHSSLGIQESTAKSVSLPLAGVALPIESGHKIDNPLVYLLYGARDALLQRHCPLLSGSNSLESLLRGGSPIVSVFRNISSSVSLVNNPLRTKALLESRVLTLLVYLAFPREDDLSDGIESRFIANGALPAATVGLTPAEVVQPFEKCAGNVETGEISSLRVSVNKITAKPSLAGGTIQQTNHVLGEVKNGLHPEKEEVDLTVPSRAARKAQTMRKDYQRQMRHLRNTLFGSSPEKKEKRTGIVVLQKATQHIFSLCSRAKELKEEKRSLREVHNRLVESYASCLEALPADDQRKAIKNLSHQIDLTARKSNGVLQGKVLADAEIQKVAKAAWSLVGPCSVQRVELRNGHTVYVYSSHTKEEEKVTDDKNVVEVEQEEETTTTTSLWVSDVGEPCFVTRLLPEDEDENR